MVNGNFVHGFDTILPIGILMMYPIWLFDVTQIGTTPTAIEAQGWLIAVVASAMGLVRIAMWLRGSKEEKSGVDTLRSIENSLKIAIEKLVENDERLSISQQRLADNQIKALENHAKLAEALTLLKVHLQGMENNILASQQRRTMGAMTEMKEFLRDTMGGK